MEKITVGIYGLGLIGGSIALAVRQHLPGSKVIGFGRDQSKLEAAKKLGVIDRAADEKSDLTGDLDFLIIGTPAEKVGEVFSRFAPGLREDVIVMDVGSVKRSVVTDVAKVNGRGITFIGTHPMAGSEKSGMEFARADLFDKKIVAIIGDWPEKIMNRIKEFWTAFGAQTVSISADFHDEIVASTSHMPHLISSAISRSLEKDGWAEVKFFGLYGKGLLDTTRVSQGSPEMWADIILHNDDNIERALIDFTREIDTLIHIIRNKKRKELIEYLSKSKEFRENL